jgi:hypothetical protein
MGPFALKISREKREGALLPLFANRPYSSRASGAYCRIKLRYDSL